MSIFVPARHGRAALGELDHVDWSRLRTGHGKPGEARRLLRPGTGAVHERVAPTMGELLASLGADHPSDVADAVDAVFDAAWRQGSVFAATLPAVPFLTALVADPGVPRRERLLALLVYAFQTAVYGPVPELVAIYAASRAHLERASAEGNELCRRAARTIVEWPPGEASDDGYDRLEQLAHALEDAAAS